MALQNNTIKYGTVAKMLHWVMAILIIAMLVMGLIINDMSPSLDKLKLIGLHKSTGIVLLGLVMIRVIWKYINVAPLLPYKLKKLEKMAAYLAHALLYMGMFAMPLSGWAMSSAAGYKVSVFGWFTLPALMTPDKQMRIFFSQSHQYIAWGLIIMLALHVMAALLHHFYHRNNILLRMLPYGRLRQDIHTDSDTMAGC